MTLILVTLNVGLLSVTALYAQAQYFKFLQDKRQHLDQELTESKLSKLTKDFEEYKKRVDHLSLKSGFKL